MRNRRKKWEKDIVHEKIVTRVVFGNQKSNNCDADWASDSDWKSISSYVIIIAGGAIAWSSKKQNTVAPSTPKAEYIAATHVAKQVLWHQSLLTKLKFPLSTPSIIFLDNQSAIIITHHPKFHTHTKHIDIALHFLQDHMNKGTLNMFYIKTNYNITNIFTKALTQLIYQNFTYKLGIIPVKGVLKESHNTYVDSIKVLNKQTTSRYSCLYTHRIA